MTIRKLKQSEKEDSIRLSEFAFQYSMTDEERKERLAEMTPDDTWVIEEDGHIISKASVLPLNVYLHGREVKMGGVSGVATWPEHRRGGLVAKLLKHSLQDMKQKGQLLSFLYPFSVPFYRKYGWEMFADMATLTLTKEQLPGHGTHEGKVKRIDKDYSQIENVYHTWARQYSGTLVRDEKWWKKSVFKQKKGTLAAYYNSNEEMTGYILFEVKERKMTVHELVWLDADARKGLFSFISNHDSMIETAVIKTTPAGPLPFILPDPKVKRDTASYFMARIVDVKAFLASYPFQFAAGDPPLIFHVNDGMCEWNDGTFIVKPSQDGSSHEVDGFEGVSGTGAACQHPPKKGLSVSVNHLTAILMGAQSVQPLLQEEMIRGDKRTAGNLTEAVPNLTPFLYDFF